MTPETTANAEFLKKCNVLLAVPCYGGVLSNFTESLLGLEMLMKRLGARHTVRFLDGESLINRARNVMVTYVLDDPSYTHLFFIDADIGFDPADFIRLLLHRKPVIAGCYPLKAYNWQLIAQKIMIMARSVPDELNINIHRLLEETTGVVGNVYNPEKLVIGTDGCTLALDAPTGFMCIQRTVLEQLARECPHLSYRNDVPGYPQSQNYYAFFHSFIDMGSNRRYLSEDYGFSRLCQQHGMQVWFDMTLHLTHGRDRIPGHAMSYYATLLGATVEGLEPSITVVKKTTKEEEAKKEEVKKEEVKNEEAKKEEVKKEDVTLAVIKEEDVIHVD